MESPRKLAETAKLSSHKTAFDKVETEPREQSALTFGDAREQYKKDLINLPVQRRTQIIINEIQEILGHTELHPQVVEKITDLYEKVQEHTERLKNIDDLFVELRGVSMPEITKLIDRKKMEIMSTVEENTVYVRMIQDDHNNMKYRLSNISLEEKKARDAMQSCIINYISTTHG